MTQAPQKTRRRPGKINPNMDVVNGHIDQTTVYPMYRTDGEVVLVQRTLVRADGVQMGDLIAGQKVIGINVAEHNKVRARRFSTEADLDDGSDGWDPEALFRGEGPGEMQIDDSRLVWTDDALLLVERPIRLGSITAKSACASLMAQERRGEIFTSPGVAHAYGFATAIDDKAGWEAIDEVIGKDPAEGADPEDPAIDEWRWLVRHWKGQPDQVVTQRAESLIETLQVAVGDIGLASQAPQVAEDRRDQIERAKTVLDELEGRMDVMVFLEGIEVDTDVTLADLVRAALPKAPVPLHTQTWLDKHS